MVEYQKRHNPIWPERAEILKQAGLSDYSIFFEEENLTWFAVQKLGADDPSAGLLQSPVIQKWRKHMAPSMEVNAATLRPLKHSRKVFIWSETRTISSDRPIKS